MYWTPYVLLHLAAAAASGLAASLVWRHRQTPGARILLYLVLASLYWSVANALELTSSTLAAKSFWAALEYPAIVGLPVLWFVFALRYTGRDRWLTSRRLALLAVVPLVSLALIATNRWHGLMRYDIALDTSGPFSVITKSYGPWFYVSALYSHTLILAGSAVLAGSLIRSHYLYQMQGISLLVAVLLPLGVNLAYIFGRSPIPRMDLTPPAFAVSGLVVALSVLRYRMLDLVPAARNQVIDSMVDSVLVLDERGRIVDLNPAGARALGVSPQNVIGLAGAEVMASSLALSQRLLNREVSRSEISFGNGEGERRFDVEMSALFHHGRVSGWVVVFRDVTARRVAELEREALIEELQEALTNIRTLRGLIPICASCKKVRDDQGYWQQVEEYVRTHSEASFTHSICPECMKVLYPEMSEET